MKTLKLKRKFSLGLNNMCGITLVSSNNIKKKKDFNSLGLNIISHRGNDSVNHADINHLVSVGHRRLAITGENGAQPISHKQIHVLSNGEFYDYEIIKGSIQEYNFKTDSDAELLIPLYNEYGINNMMNYLHGEFAFIIIDTDKNLIHLVRDMIGNKTLYYSHDNNDLFVASEIKAFKSIKKLSFDKETLNQKIQMQYHHPSRTLFEGIYQIEPGQIITYDYIHGTLSKEFHKDIYIQNNEDQISNEKVLTLLKNSVQRRILNQNPAITLSGGLDSTIILDLVQELNPKIKECFSISFKNGGLYDEKELVNIIKDHYNINLNLLELTQKQLIDSFEESIYHAEDIAINMHMPAKFLLFKEIHKKGYKTSLSGEGSDEFFMGYSHFYPVKDNYLKGMHLPEGSILSTNNLNHLPLFLKAKLSIGNKIKNLLNHDPITLDIDLYNTDSLDDTIKSSYLWIKYALSNSILIALGDKMEMASTIEGRTPFLDKNLIEYIMGIKTSNKLSELEDKTILRQIFRTRLPKEILQKSKHPFLAPPLIGDKEGQEYVYEILQKWNTDLISKEKTLELLKYLSLKNDKDELRTYDPVFMILTSLALIQKRLIDD